MNMFNVLADIFMRLILKLIMKVQVGNENSLFAFYAGGQLGCNN